MSVLAVGVCKILSSGWIWHLSSSECMCVCQSLYGSQIQIQMCLILSVYEVSSCLTVITVSPHYLQFHSLGFFQSPLPSITVLLNLIISSHSFWQILFLSVFVFWCVFIQLINLEPHVYRTSWFRRLLRY